MAGKRIPYRIEINGGAGSAEPYTYQFGRTPDIAIAVEKQRATVAFSLTVRKTLQDFTGMKVQLFRDALRKAYILHALLHDEGLQITAMKITIAGQSYILNEKTKNFPFVFSMITTNRLHLSDAWHSAEVIRYYLDTCKTGSDTNYANCAVHAYLAAKSRRYRTDRFLNYWTAMNAYYNSISARFEDAYIAHNGSLGSTYKCKNYDSPGIGALTVSKIREDCILPKDLAKLPEFDSIYKDTNRKLFHAEGIDPDVLYEESRKHLDNRCAPDDPYRELYEAADTMGIPLFVYLLLIYPYMLRCNYFHGSKVQPVISAYTDPEIFDLWIINRFLERFLNDAIPEMFAPGPMAEDEYEKIRHFCRKRK